MFLKVSLPSLTEEWVCRPVLYALRLLQSTSL